MRTGNGNDNKRGFIRVRRIFCLLAACLAMLGMSGCQNTKLADGYDEEVIKETAEEIINDVQLNGAKEVLTERMREDCIENVDLDTMNNTVVNLMKGKGGFMVYSKETVVGKEHPDLKENLAVILVTATFEKGEINYTITFDKDMKVVGFYAQ